MSAYATDIAAWSASQATLLRRIARGEQVNDQIDWENVAEEIDALGRSDKRELRNRIATILLHLIKLQASSAIAPRAGWRETVRTQRHDIRRLMEESPSLRSTVAAIVSGEIDEAKANALASMVDHGEQPRAELSALNYTDDQVLGPWLPD